MINMSHCMMENTFLALQEVMNAMQTEAEASESLSDSEAEFQRKLLELCKEMAECMM